MTRLRKEIHKEMDKLYLQEQAEYEMGCGFCVSEIAAAFETTFGKLYEKLAASYGLTVQEYEARQYEISNKLFAAGVLPFN